MIVLDAAVDFVSFGSIIGVTLIQEWDQIWLGSIGCPYWVEKTLGSVIWVTVWPSFI